MIIFNGNKFAKNDKELTDSLFDSNGTCIGFYKKTKRGIQLMNMQKELMAFIVDNGYGERFVVSARRIKNKIHYMYSTSSIEDKYLGLDKIGYRQQIEECEKIFKGQHNDY